MYNHWHGGNRLIMDTNFKRFIRYLLCITAMVLIVTHFDSILLWTENIWAIVFPLFLGCFMAYVINIIMKALEDHWFPDSQKPSVNRMKRGICLFISIFLIFAVLFLIMRIVLPELIEAFSVIGKTIPIYFEKMQSWIVENGKMFPSIVKEVERMEVDWQYMFKKLAGFATSGVSSMLNSAVSILSRAVGSIVNIAIALIFAIYILINKEKLAGQLKAMEKAYLKPSFSKTINHILNTADSCFKSFITGQCVEAVILGILCTVGMFVFRFPYAPMVGTFIGATALIPMVGAYIGAIVGGFMIFTVSPVKALGFLIFIVVLQQIEGNLIYPKVVGSSIGLPGMWVLTAVTVGGGLAGIPGMLFGVPLAATLYRLISIDVKKRTKNAT